MPAVATDPVQRVVEAVVALLDTAPSIVALTGHASENVVPRGRLAEADPPIIGFSIAQMTRGGAATGDVRRVVLAFSCVASLQPADALSRFGDALANALAREIEVLLTPAALFALPSPLDVFGPIAITRRGVPFSPDDAAARADVDAQCMINFA